MAKTAFRSRTLSAALVTLGCSLGVSLTPEMLAAEKKAAPAPVPLEAKQHKEWILLEKAVADSKATLEANQWKCRDFEKSLTPETAKLEANQHKLREMKAAVARDTAALQAAQAKLAAAPKK